MKKYKYIIGVAAIVAACNQKEVKEVTIGEQLAERLQALQQRGYMMGH